MRSSVPSELALKRQQNSSRYRWRCFGLSQWKVAHVGALEDRQKLSIPLVWMHLPFSYRTYSPRLWATEAWVKPVMVL